MKCDIKKQELNNMRIEAGRQGATIIPFPNSAQLQARRFEQEARRIVESRYETVSDYEGGWYHNDAIRDADRNNKQ
jgi:hypothetical protein